MIYAASENPLRGKFRVTVLTKIWDGTVALSPESFRHSEKSNVCFLNYLIGALFSFPRNRLTQISFFRGPVRRNNADS
jgi:hypothetical protein